jgi:hypothetical protein
MDNLLNIYLSLKNVANITKVMVQTIYVSSTMSQTGTVPGLQPVPAKARCLECLEFHVNSRQST